MHVLLATDGSEASIDAANRGLRLLPHATVVTVLNVVTEVPGDDAGGFEGSVYSPEEQDALWSQELAEAAAEIERTAAAIGDARVDRRIEVGDVANTICRIAKEVAADVIVVGSHGRTGIGRLFLGSVSEHVVRHAPCPVLVVRDEHHG